MRHGEPEPYLAQAARRGRLQVADDPMAARQRLLEDWWQTAQPDLEETVMLVYRRADVRGLNDAAHVLMLRAGRLGPQAVELDEREFRVGDRASAIQEWGYVACTRARTETHLYLSEHDAIERETPLRDPDPAAPPVRAARALERAVAEPLALDRARQRHDANARLYSRRQEQLEQQRARSAERLANRPARAQTARLVERGGRRVELEREDHPSADRAPGLRRQAGRAAPNSVRVPARPTARS